MMVYLLTEYVTAMGRRREGAFAVSVPDAPDPPDIIKRGSEYWLFASMMDRCAREGDGSVLPDHLRCRHEYYRAVCVEVPSKLDRMKERLKDDTGPHAQGAQAQEVPGHDADGDGPLGDEGGVAGPPAPGE